MLGQTRAPAQGRACVARQRFRTAGFPRYGRKVWLNETVEGTIGVQPDPTSGSIGLFGSHLIHSALVLERIVVNAPIQPEQENT